MSDKKQMSTSAASTNSTQSLDTEPRVIQLKDPRDIMLAKQAHRAKVTGATLISGLKVPNAAPGYCWYIMWAEKTPYNASDVGILVCIPEN